MGRHRRSSSTSRTRSTFTLFFRVRSTIILLFLEWRSSSDRLVLPISCLSQSLTCLSYFLSWCFRCPFSLILLSTHLLSRPCVCVCIYTKIYSSLWKKGGSLDSLPFCAAQRLTCQLYWLLYRQPDKRLTPDWLLIIVAQVFRSMGKLLHIPDCLRSENVFERTSLSLL